MVPVPVFTFSLDESLSVEARVHIPLGFASTSQKYKVIEFEIKVVPVID